MKSKKLFLPIIILAVAIFATAAYLIIGSIALKPTVTEAEFPFQITYELDGETVTIDDIYQVNYSPSDRVYTGKLLSSGEDDTNIILKQDETTRIELSTYLYADYLMGDPEYDYFEDTAFEPVLYYYDENEAEYYDEETLAEQGVRLISFQYPTPIENKMVFSHLSYLSGENVFPMFMIALLALIAILVFVKKETELTYKTVDRVCIVSNWVVGTLYLGFVTILALLIDIEGGGPELYYQIMYLVPAVSLLCLAASVALRRKGYGKSALVTGLIGPAVFALYLLVFYAGGLR